MSSCSDLKLAYDNLQTLTDELKLKLQELIAGNVNLEEAKELKTRVEVADWEYEKRLRMMEEKIALDKFFGSAIEVPTLPKEITPEKLEAWEKLGLELHYLPKMKLDEEANYPGWKKRPNYQYVDKKILSIDFLTIPGGWMLIDGRTKPEVQDGNQMYPNDPPATVLEELRNEGKIQKFKHPTSRYNLSLEELENPEVRTRLAHVFGIDPQNFSLPTYTEFNILGNMHHPEWGDTSTSEWFADKYDDGTFRLFGGDWNVGGLSYVGWRGPGDRYDSIGFRVIGRFS